MISSAPRAALGLGAIAAAAAAALVPAAPATAAPDTSAARAAAVVSPGPYGGYSSGTINHVSAVGVVGTTVAQLSLGQSSAAVGKGQALQDQDVLGSSILNASPAGKNAYGHGSGVNVGVLQNPAAVPQIGLTTAEALSPPPRTATATELVTLPLSPLATAQLLPSNARALTTSLATGCPATGSLISSGSAQVANAAVLTPVPGQAVLGVGGTSESISQTLIAAPAAGAQGNGLTTRTTQRLAPLTLLQGLGGAGVRIEVLKDIVLTTTAGGVNGSAKVSYGFAGVATNNTTTPVLAITANGTRTALTSQQLLGNGGLQLSLGVADVFIGAPAHGLNDNPTSPVTASANGRTASAAADFIRVTVPGTVPTGSTIPVTGPLAPVLNPILAPVVSALSPVLTALQSALDTAGLDVADVRYGHLESTAFVPAGGIICTASDEDPLNESFKDVSTRGVAPGATFDYTVRFPNRGSQPLTNVVVRDTFAGGLEFVSSSPQPSSRSGNTLTYNVGTVAPGAFAQISLTFRVPTDAAPGTRYRNTAVISGTYQGETITKTVTVDGPTVIDRPTGGCDLSRSTKYSSNTQVRTGQSLAYFINVSNTGGQNCTGIVVRDNVPTGTDFLSCTDGCTRAGRTLTWDIDTLTPGSSRTLSFVTRVTATRGTLPNVATVTPDSGKPGRPSTGGPTVTNTTTPSPGKPAGCPASGCPGTGGDGNPGTSDPDDLAETGMQAGLPVLGALLLGAGALGLRRRRASV